VTIRGFFFFTEAAGEEGLKRRWLGSAAASPTPSGITLGRTYFTVRSVNLTAYPREFG